VTRDLRHGNHGVVDTLVGVVDDAKGNNLAGSSVGSLMASPLEFCVGRICCDDCESSACDSQLPVIGFPDGVDSSEAWAERSESLSTNKPSEREKSDK
jgi:hypothetical protein